MQKRGYSEDTAGKISGTLKERIEKAEEVFVFDVKPLLDSDREFIGVASTPEIDRENEIIDEAALDKAMKLFMNYPVIDYFHTGRPIAYVVNTWKEDDKRYIHGKIRPDEMGDPYWEQLQKGDLGQLSIAGQRLEGTPACKLRPEHRTEPCVTKKLWLWCISLCPTGTANNRKTWAEVVKAMSSGSSLMHTTTDGIINGEKTMDNENPPVDDKEKDLEKSDEDTISVEDRIAALEDAISEILSKLDGMEKACGEDDDTVQKAEKDDADAAGEIKKALTSEIAKATKDLQKIIDDQKAVIDTQAGDIKKANDAIEKIQKAMLQPRTGFIFPDKLQGEGYPTSGAAANVFAMSARRP